MSASNNARRLPLYLPANVLSRDREHPVFSFSLAPDRPTGPASRNFLCKLQGIHQASTEMVVIRERKATATSLVNDSIRSARFRFPRTKNKNGRVLVKANPERRETTGARRGCWQCTYGVAQQDASVNVLQRFSPSRRDEIQSSE